MEQLLDLTVGLPERVVEAGDALISAGEPADHLFVLLEGRLIVRRDGVDFVQLDEPGSCIGEKALLLGRSHASSVVAAERSRVRVIENAVGTLRNDPAILHAVAILLARRLEMVESYLDDLKHQYQDHEGGLGMIGEVLTTLTTHHGDTVTPGSDREPDPLY